MKQAEALLKALRGILAMDKEAYGCAWAYKSSTACAISGCCRDTLCIIGHPRTCLVMQSMDV